MSGATAGSNRNAHPRFAAREGKSRAAGPCVAARAHGDDGDGTREKLQDRKEETLASAERSSEMDRQTRADRHIVIARLVPAAPSVQPIVPGAWCRASRVIRGERRSHG